MNRHENMGIKRKTKELNKQQKTNVYMLLQSINDLKVCTEQEYSLIINDNFEYSLLCKLKNYFD